MWLLVTSISVRRIFRIACEDKIFIVSCFIRFLPIISFRGCPRSEIYAMVFPKKEMAITEKIYPSDLTDTQWNLIAPLIPKAKTGGRPRSVDMRNTLDAILYINRTGAQWRYLPEKYPPRSTVFEYFSRWQKDGTWDLMNNSLRENVRLQSIRNSTPTASIIDSQTVKSTQESSIESGHDGGKKN